MPVSTVPHRESIARPRTVANSESRIRPVQETQSQPPCSRRCVASALATSPSYARSRMGDRGFCDVRVGAEEAQRSHPQRAEPRTFGEHERHDPQRASRSPCARPDSQRVANERGILAEPLPPRDEPLGQLVRTLHLLRSTSPSQSSERAESSLTVVAVEMWRGMWLGALLNGSERAQSRTQARSVLTRSAEAR